jgi:hypothetical protein
MSNQTGGAACGKTQSRVWPKWFRPIAVEHEPDNGIILHSPICNAVPYTYHMRQSFVSVQPQNPRGVLQQLEIGTHVAFQVHHIIDAQEFHSVSTGPTEYQPRVTAQCRLAVPYRTPAPSSTPAYDQNYSNVCIPHFFHPIRS